MESTESTGIEVKSTQTMRTGTGKGVSGIGRAHTLSKLIEHSKFATKCSCATAVLSARYDLRSLQQPGQHGIAPKAYDIVCVCRK